MVNNIVTRHSASTILFNDVDNYKQCGNLRGAQRSVLLNCRLIIFGCVFEEPGILKTLSYSLEFVSICQPL